MFNPFKPKPSNKSFETIILKLSGLHCTSCAVNIDLTLEELPGVINSKTNYQKSETTVTFDPLITNIEKITRKIIALGYNTEPS